MVNCSLAKARSLRSQTAIRLETKGHAETSTSADTARSPADRSLRVEAHQLEPGYPGELPNQGACCKPRDAIPLASMTCAALSASDLLRAFTKYRHCQNTLRQSSYGRCLGYARSRRTTQGPCGTWSLFRTLRKRQISTGMLI